MVVVSRCDEVHSSDDGEQLSFAEKLQLLVQICWG